MKNLKINDEAHFKLKTYCDTNNLKMNEWVSDKIIEITKNYIYVEIAPRNCGKTTRLVNSICDTINSEIKSLPIAVISPNVHTSNLIKEMLISRGVDINKIIFSDTMYINDNSYSYFIDEFDYINRDKLFISDGAYYCGTLKNSEGDTFTKKLYNTFLNSVLWKR